MVIQKQLPTMCALCHQRHIELIRNTPFLVQLFFFFFALPALVINQGAFYYPARQAWG